jgi:hypothetical protein
VEHEYIIEKNNHNMNHYRYWVNFTTVTQGTTGALALNAVPGLQAMIVEVDDPMHPAMEVINEAFNVRI